MQLNSRFILVSIIVVICGAFIPLATTSQVPDFPAEQKLPDKTD